jgi:hypothetical protein
MWSVRQVASSGVPQTKSDNIFDLCGKPPSDNDIGKNYASDEALLSKTLSETAQNGGHNKMDHLYDDETGELPDRISGSYTDDYNILRVHELILARFQQRKEHRMNHTDKHIALLQRQRKTIQTVVEMKAIERELKKLEDEAHRIDNDVDLNLYLEETRDLLDIYRSLGSVVKVVSFGAEDKAEEEQDSSKQEETELRHLVISSYLEIARKYIIVDVIRDISANTKCQGCGTDLSDLAEDESGIQKCLVCGVEKISLVRTPFYRDVERVNTSERNGYDNAENFEKALMRYQGKQPNRLPSALFTDLDKYFQSYHLPTAEQVRKQPLLSNGTKQGTSREIMLGALSDTGYTAYYEDLNLICHLYWGWNLPDVSHLEEVIMDDYRRAQQIFDRIPKDRKSCLNSQYRLFKHLQHRHHPCSIDDFKVVKTRDILEYHDDTWRVICAEAGWEFIPTI